LIEIENADVSIGSCKSIESYFHSFPKSLLSVNHYAITQDLWDRLSTMMPIKLVIFLLYLSHHDGTTLSIRSEINLEKLLIIDLRKMELDSVATYGFECDFSVYVHIPAYPLSACAKGK